MTNNESREAFEKMGQLVQFLLGEDSYMGLQFGDSVQYGRTQARFWWRTDLRKLWATFQARQPEIDTLKARIVELEARVKELGTPEWYNDSDGEYSSSDAEEIAYNADIRVGGIVQAYGARLVAIKYVAYLAVDYDEDGEVNKAEYVVFDTMEEAQQAVAAMPKPPTKQE